MVHRRIYAGYIFAPYDHQTVDDVELKQYTKCKQWKDKNEFYRNRRSKNGLKSQCKTCSSKYAKKRTVRSDSGL